MVLLTLAPTLDLVGSCAADEQVGAFATVQFVLAGTAHEDIRSQVRLAIAAAIIASAAVQFGAGKMSFFSKARKMPGLGAWDWLQ